MKRVYFSRFLRAALALLLPLPLVHSAEVTLPHTTSWVANSYGRGDGLWIQNNILGIYASADGLLYTNSWWDEGRRESGIYDQTTGRPKGALESLHDTFGGGFAVTGGDGFIYAANWDNIRRCRPDGTPAPFPGGAGPHRDSVRVATAPTGKDKSRGIRGLALDAVEKRLWVSQSIDDELQLWNPEKMALLGRWSVARPGPLAVADDHTVWIISRREGDLPASILHFSAKGEALPDSISGPPGFDPTAICFDPTRECLLVADNGPAQNIQIYPRLKGNRKAPNGTFGAGVFEGVPGRITDKKFGHSGFTGLAVDAAGNLFVSMNGVGPASFWHGAGTVLESWSPQGKLRWRKLGLAFVDCADADPAVKGDVIDLYDKYSHYRFDLGKTAAGTEWSYVGHTLDQFRHPADQRFLRAADGWDYTGGTFVRNVNGHRLLYVLSMQARRILIYRFDEARMGEIAIPAGLWESQYGYKAGYAGAPDGGDFFWRDADGDGTFDDSEFAKGPGLPNLGLGMFVDSRGDFWTCNHWAGNGIGIRRWRMQGFDPKGNPIYDYAPEHYTEYQRPAGSHGELRRVEYIPETDTLYVTSTSKPDGDRDIGSRIVKYKNWSTPERAVEWTLDPPLDGTKISALSVAGDYVFLGYSYFGSNRREGTIRVFRTADAGYVGEITPTPAVGSLCGTFDIPYAIRAHRCSNGEYVICAEDDHFAKVLVHRWHPTEPVLVDELEDLSRTDATRTVGKWDIDQSNKEHFNHDAARARRQEDATQSLVWEVPAMVSFAASVYFDSRIDADAYVSFSTSADGEKWTPVSTSRTPTVSSGGGWAVANYRPEGELPALTRFVRFELKPSKVSWNIQLGRMEIYRRERRLEKQPPHPGANR